MEKILEQIGKEDSQKLNELLNLIVKYQHIYDKAKNPAYAQLWLAVLEIYKRQKKLNSLLSKLERMIAKMEQDEKMKLKNSVLADLEEY